MLKHEAKLIDPDAEQIVEALTETAAAANKRYRGGVVVDNPAKWRKTARAAVRTREGYATFSGPRIVPASQVLAAWWTDAIDRKHVVIRGHRVEHHEAIRVLETDSLNDQPPLRHAYPEYVCQRR